MTITVYIPDSVLDGLQLLEGEVEPRLRTELAVTLYAQQVLSLGKAAELERVSLCCGAGMGAARRARRLTPPWVAAAVRAAASVIVTYNLKDFPAAALAPYGVEAQHPDEFIARLLDREPQAVVAAARRQRASLRNPPRSAAEYLETLERAELTQIVSRLRATSGLL